MPDMTVHETQYGDKGIDLNIGVFNLSCKGTKNYAKYLLLETKDYTLDGFFKLANETVKIDYFCVVKLDIELEKDITLYKNKIYDYDSPRVLSNHDFVKGITSNSIFKSGTLMGKVPLQVDNYKFLITDLPNIKVLENKIRKPRIVL